MSRILKFSTYVLFAVSLVALAAWGRGIRRTWAAQELPGVVAQQAFAQAAAHPVPRERRRQRYGLCVEVKGMGTVCCPGTGGGSAGPGVNNCSGDVTWNLHDVPVGATVTAVVAWYTVQTTNTVTEVAVTDPYGSGSDPGSLEAGNVSITWPMQGRADVAAAAGNVAWDPGSCLFSFTTSDSTLNGIDGHALDCGALGPTTGGLQVTFLTC